MTITFDVGEGDCSVIAYKDDDEGWNTIRCFKEGEYLENEDCLLSVDNGRILFIATTAGRIYRSIDKAKTWQVIEDGIFFNTPYISISKFLNKIYAVNRNGVIYSSDNGDIWNYVSKEVLESLFR